MSKSVTLSQFREDFHKTIDAIEANGGTLTLTRNGRPVAVVLSAVEYERLMDAFDLLYGQEDDLASGDDLAESFYL